MKLHWETSELFSTVHISTEFICTESPCTRTFMGPAFKYTNSVIKSV